MSPAASMEESANWELGVARKTLRAARASLAEDNYQLSRSDVEAFLSFLKACGGFRIC
jgi:hypothetical protein